MKIELAKSREPSDNLKKNDSDLNRRISAYTETFKEEYYKIPIEKLRPYKNQSREYFDEDKINDLAESIKNVGIRQPLTVISIEDGLYAIVSGERRYKAAQKLGLTHLPCITLKDDTKVDEIAIIENIHREDLHPVELMKAYELLLVNGICKSSQEIANKIGVLKSKVIETLGLKKIIPELRSQLISSKINSRNILRKLCKMSDARQNLYLQNLISAKAIQDDSFQDSEEINAKSINRKTKVLTIVKYGDDIKIEQVKNKHLTLKQKEDLKSILNKLIEIIDSQELDIIQ
jgi:ParB family chromosome partitioning protein